MYEGKRVLVTGGAGFLGSNLVKKLAAEAKHVWVLDDLFTGQRSAVPQRHNVTFVHGSVTDGTLLRKLLSQVEYVFHFAARNITLSVEQPEADFRTNVEGTVQLMLQAVAYKDQIERVVYASTSSIYGNSRLLPTVEGGYDIGLPYAASKMSAELLSIAYGKTFGLPVTCLRFSNVYGPGQVSSNPYCGVVAKFAEAILQGEPMVVYGDGTQTRDFTFVDDAIHAVLLTAFQPGTAGEVFNVGTGVETSINTLAKLVAAGAGKPTYSIRHAPKRPVDTVDRRCISSEKLQLVTRWSPQVSVQKGLEKTWQWLQGQV